MIFFVQSLHTLVVHGREAALIHLQASGDILQVLNEPLRVVPFATGVASITPSIELDNAPIPMGAAGMGG